MSNGFEKRHLSQFSDEEVMDLYQKHNGNATKASAECGVGRSTFSERVRLIQDENYQAQKGRAEALAYLQEELEARGIDPREVRVGKATVKTQKKRYQAFHKDKNTQQAVITPMKSDNRLVSITFSPKFEDGPKWPLVKPADIGKITYVPKADQIGPERRVFFWPDTQIGYYRSVLDNSLTPFHDEKAINVALQMLHAFNATEVIILGDFWDLPSMSRWLQLPEFQFTIQPSIQYGYNLLAKIRAIVGPDTKITFIPGNHERRLAEYIAKNAMNALGIRSATTNPDDLDPVTLVPKKWDWPHYSIPKLAHFDQLKIDYLNEYPGGQYWLTDRLVATHQPPSANYDLRATVVHGHTPQDKRFTRTVHYRDESVEYRTISIAGLMRTDETTDKVILSPGSVPTNRERRNWQQAVGTALIFREDLFDVQTHPIKNGEGIFRGMLFTSSI